MENKGPGILAGIAVILIIGLLALQTFFSSGCRITTEPAAQKIVNP